MKTSILSKIALLILISSFFYSAFARAEELDPVFEPKLLEEYPFHIFAGIGANFSTFKSTDGDRDMGLGSVLKTDLSWYFNERWAIESSATVKFNRVDDNRNLTWETLLTLGFRYHLQEPFWGISNLYTRGYAGYGVLVYYPDDTSIYDGLVDRYQAEGATLGAGIGRMMISEGRTTWFVESSFSIQHIANIDAIAMDGETPVVTGRRPIARNSYIYSVAVAIGLALF